MKTKEISKQERDELISLLNRIDKRIKRSKNIFQKSINHYRYICDKIISNLFKLHDTIADILNNPTTRNLRNKEKKIASISKEGEENIKELTDFFNVNSDGLSTILNQILEPELNKSKDKTDYIG